MASQRLSWTVTALWLGVMLSAIAVVSVSHACRTLYAELAELERSANQLQVEWGQLLLEKATLASFGGIERVAQEQLNMRAPGSAEIVVVKP